MRRSRPRMAATLSRGRIEFRAGAATDVGLVRHENEDGYLVHPRVFAVADGMGGMRAGEVASAIALDTLSADADADSDMDVVQWVIRANRAVFDRAITDPSMSGMGTTLVAVVVRGDMARIVHLGDSRAYLLREGRLEQLTEDHSHVQRLLDVGLITPEEADRHPERNLVTRALGLDESVDPEERDIAVLEEDRLLLCTDGLSTMLEAEEIRAILAAGEEPSVTAQRLVDAANVAGGRDNATALVIDVVLVSAEAGAARPETGTDDANRDEASTDEDETSSVGLRNRFVGAFIAIALAVIALGVAGWYWLR
jgi:serine/threonine protein phosphatase PrpC